MPGTKARHTSSPSATNRDPLPTLHEEAPPTVIGTRIEEEEEEEGEEEAWVVRAKDIFTDSDWEAVGECDADEDDAEYEAKIEKHNRHVQKVLARREKKKAAADELLDDAKASADDADDAEEEQQARAQEGDGEGEGEGEDGEGEGEDGEEGEEGEAPSQVDALMEDVEGLERLTLDDVPEKNVTVYSKKTHGVPEHAYMLEGPDAVQFEDQAAMNAMLVSKSPKPFIKLLRTRHMTVLRSDERLLPANAVVNHADGTCNGALLNTFGFETFLYIRCYVKPDPNDAASVTRAEHDKRRLRHLTKAVALGVHKHLMGLDLFKNPDRRNTLKSLVDWVPCKDPQVVPKVAKWPLYEGLVLETSFKEKESTPRKIGVNSKKFSQGEASAPTKSTAAPKRKVVVKHDDESDGEGSRDTAPRSSDSHMAEDKAAPTKLEAQVRKRVRYYQIDDSARTHVHMVPGKDLVCITEYY